MSDQTLRNASRNSTWVDIMITSQQLNEIKQRLDRITADANEVCAQWGMMLGTTMTTRKNGKEIYQNCQRLSSLIATGDVLKTTNIPPSSHPIEPNAAANIQSILRTMQAWSQELENVPYSDSDAQKHAVALCKDIPARCNQIWSLLQHSTGTGR
jgi:hypothetical protein